ncbi:MAG: DUF1653 domain-containing protein [Bacillota bacterium]|nr:DUF1653 domain-containing protein [Bacillota bacterium]
MSNKPTPQQIYRHFKGNLYRIVTLAKHSETGEELVIYQALYGDYQVYARPLSMFMEKVDRTKYPDAGQEYRFELQQELIQMPSVQEFHREPEPKQEPQQELKQEPEQETVGIPIKKEQEELNIDPLVLEFLDADSYEERLNILAALHHRITDEMINTMAISVDLEIEEGDTEQRYEELKNCLLTFEKFECNRLR